jgi:hypothetical protein
MLEELKQPHPVLRLAYDLDVGGLGQGGPDALTEDSVVVAYNNLDKLAHFILNFGLGFLWIYVW